MTVDYYSSCEEYKGNDKFVCESIKSNKTLSHCVLEDDLNCTERTFPCSEVTDKEDCLFYAKPIDSKKRCVYNSGYCYEVYEKCEDYLGNIDSECEGLNLFNGKKCVFESNKCVSKNKTCEEATTQDECELIAKTGVSDPNKKVCDFLTFTITEGGSSYTESRCVENYKYCSNYRGNDVTTCENIKPYDETGTYIDETAKCQIFDDIDGDNSKDLCQKVTKGCSDANNPVQCDRISPKIKDNNIKYCAFIDGSCTEYYKKCNEISTSNTPDNCENNIPENYLTSHCKAALSSSGRYYSCGTKSNCDSFKETYYANYCQSIHNNCSYSSYDNTCSLKTIYHCSDKIFYEVNEENEAVCNSLEVSSPNHICVLNEEKSACKEILKNITSTSSSSSSDSSNQGNSVELLVKRIPLVLILLHIFL